MCLAVTARHFLSHILPSRETFDAAGGGNRDKGKAKAVPKRARGRVVSRGIGGRPILDEETAAGADWRPGRDSGDDDERASSSSSSSDARRSNKRPRRLEVGIAATPRSMRSKRVTSGNPTSKRLPALTTQELTAMSQEHHQLLKILPDATAVKLLRLLRTQCPEALTRHVLTTYFVVGRTDFELDASMTLLTERPQDINLIIRSAGSTIGAAATASPLPGSLLQTTSFSRPLRRLSLSGMTRLDPVALSALFRRYTALEEVVLKGCVRVNADCMKALVESGDNATTLRVLNLNFTEIGEAGVEAVVSRCRNLEVLKLANVLGLTDRVVPEMLRRCAVTAADSSSPFVPLSRLKTLKLRATEVGTLGVSSFLQLCTRTLENLDLAGLGLASVHGVHTLRTVLNIQISLSSSMIRSKDRHLDDLPPPIGKPPPLRKLNLSDNLAPNSRPGSIDSTLSLLMLLIPPFIDTLEVLILENLGLEWKDVVTLKRGVAEHGLTKRKAQEKGQDGDDIAEQYKFPLRRLSLAYSLPTVLEVQDIWDVEHEDTTSQDEAQRLALNASLKAQVQDLTLAGTDLRQEVFWKMSMPNPYDPVSQLGNGNERKTRSWASIQRLDLAHTHITDFELATITRCLCSSTDGRASALREIDLAGTSVTGEGVKALIKACPYVERINLTGARGVGVRERRGIFETLPEEEEEEKKEEADAKQGLPSGTQTKNKDIKSKNKSARRAKM